MKKGTIMNGDRARAYPPGDAQMQHPATVRNGQGLLYQGRMQHKKLVQNVRIRMRFASWNVGSMTGRARELAEVFKRRRINVACLQETKWKGMRAREIGEGYKFYYCGSDGKRNGVGIVLDDKLKECVTEVNRVNDRLIAIKVMKENLVLNIISAYAPQTGCDERVKEKFWEDFDMLIMGLPSKEELIIGGDFNGHVGRMNDDYERVHGGWGFGTRNDDGKALMDAATAFDLAIVNTFFQKADQHLITYKSGNRSTQIDYFLVNKDKLNSVKDCKVVPGEAVVTQHRLLILETNFIINIKKNKAKSIPKTKWHLLENPQYAKLFRDKVVTKITEMGDLNGLEVNECWMEMAEYLRRVAKDVLGQSKGKGKIDKDTWWWNEEVQRALKEKKNAFREWQKVDERDDELKEKYKENYKVCKKRAKKVVAIAKAAAQDTLYKSLDRPEGQKHLYQIAKAREKSVRDINQVKCIKDDRGRVLTNDEEIKERWKGYFERLMNEENEWNGQLQKLPVNMGVVCEISMKEVKIAGQSMKNGKAAGPDSIPIEVWKCLKGDGWKWLALFFNKLLREEAIPEEWGTSSLVPIFKNKGDVQSCNNYRGIKLMSHTMKVWEKVIARRLRAESEVSQNQFGFMPGRSTTDAIFSLRQICEKYRRAHKNLHMVFVDLEKAYDRIPREVLWWAMEVKGVPGKYQRLIRAMYCRASTYVRSAAGNTDSFSVAVGLHQGSALSPYLFLLVMDALTSDIQEEAPWCMLFADDIVLVGEEGPEVQKRLDMWWKRLESVGLKISRTKTEQIYCNFGGPASFIPITLDGVSLPVCSDFRYLGSILQNNGDIDREIASRISAGWTKWRQVSGVTCDSRMPIRLKGKIYKTVIRPVVLYGSECWAMKAVDERRIHAAEMRMLRWMCGVTRMDKIRNEYVRGSLKVAPIIEKLKSGRLAWYGHVMRREDSHVVKRSMRMNVCGRAGRGRPKKTWMNCVKDDMSEKGVSADMTDDRLEWKKRTCCADPT